MGGKLGGEWIHIHIDGWIPLPFTWNYHKIFNQLNPIQNKNFFKNGCLPLRLKLPLLPVIWNHSVAFQRAPRSSSPLCLCTERIQQEATWWIRSDSLECFPCEAYKQVGNRLQTPGTQRATWEVGSGKGPPPSSFLSRHYASIISSSSMLVERRDVSLSLVVQEGTVMAVCENYFWSQYNEDLSLWNDTFP